MPDGHKLTQSETELQSFARRVYEERLEAGGAREQARKDLPLSTYTEAYWKIDLHNLLHFLALRMDAHAQLEIRRYAEETLERLFAEHPQARAEMEATAGYAVFHLDSVYALWVIGKPAGDGFELDPRAPGDTSAWLEVVAKPVVHSGRLLLRARSVALVPPRAGLISALVDRLRPPFLVIISQFILLGVGWTITSGARKRLDEWKQGNLHADTKKEFTAWKELTSLTSLYGVIAFFVNLGIIVLLPAALVFARGDVISSVFHNPTPSVRLLPSIF